MGKTEAGKTKAVRANRPEKVDGRHNPRKIAMPTQTDEAEKPKSEEAKADEPKKPVVDIGVSEEEEPVDDPRAFEKVGICARSQLGRNSAMIAEQIANKALAGDCTSARLLLDLGKAGEKYKKKKSGPSPTVALAKEPEWDGGRKKNEEVALAATA